MLFTLKRQIYKAFGFTIKSEIDLPELQDSIQGNDEQVDVLINFVDLTNLWDLKSSPKKMFVVEKELVMFKVSNIAIFAIRHGSMISISPQEGYDPEVVRLYTLGTCMGAILMQRKIIPLHGSAVVIDGKAYAFVGDSGAGKSTLATVLLNKGYQLLSDDVIAVSLKENLPVVTPSYPQQKLWQESLDKFGLDNKNYRPIYQRETKFAIPVKEKYSENQYPLAAIFELIKENDDKISFSTIKGLNKLGTLYNHTYRNFLLNKLGLLEWHFNMSTKMADKLEIYRLSRPVSSFTAHNLADIIFSTIHKEINR